MGVRLVSPKADPVVSVSRFLQRSVFVFSIAILVILGLGFGLGEFGLLGVHAGGVQDGAYRQMGVYGDVLRKSNPTTSPSPT